jgi:hypothetical protein
MKRIDRIKTLGALGLLLCIAPSALAQSSMDASYGYHHSLDPVDLAADEFKISVHHCRALENALSMLRDKHGWLIASETPEVVYPPDIVELFGPGGESQGFCPRPVQFEATYPADDPEVALDLILAAYNLASPPFTATSSRCGDQLCVAPLERMAAGGGVEVAPALLDTPVTIGAATRSATALLAEVGAQLETAASIQVTAVPLGSSRARWDQIELDAGFVDVPARDVLLAIATALTVYERDAKSASNHNSLQALARLDYIDEATHVCEDAEMDAGSDNAAIEAACGQLGMDAYNSFQPAPTPATPTPPLGHGPGWTWHTDVMYTPISPGWTLISFNRVPAPGAMQPQDRLTSTTPAAGVDSDGDGVMNELDLCDRTPEDALVASSGCSVRQSCPCKGTGGIANDPLNLFPPTPWANKRAYNGCVQDAVDTLVDEGLLEKNEKAAYKKEVSESGCG